MSLRPFDVAHRLGLGAIAWALCVGGAGCGGASEATRRVASLPPLSAEHGELFDDGVDLIEDPTALEGRWEEDWIREVDQRLTAADEVIRGTVRTVRTDVDLSDRTSYRVVFEVERAYKGKPGREVTLTSADGAIGHASVARYADGLLDRQFVAFTKRAGGPNGAEVRHFHLTPPSAALERRLQQFEAGQRPNTIRVIEHRN